MWQYVRTYYCIGETRCGIAKPRASSPLSRLTKPLAPRYRIVADKLIAGILGGKYPLGSVLPGETEVAAQFEVSRHTARDAMRLIEEAGMIRRKRRVGSKVVSDQLPMRYNQRINSLSDVLQYGNASRLRVLESSQIVLDETLAARLRLKPGAPCMLLKCIRHQRHDERPFAYSEIYFPGNNAAQRERMLDSELATIELVKFVDTPRLSAIEQTLVAETVSADLAAMLQVKSGAATLKAVRIYVATSGRIAAAATTWHAGDLFSYSTTLTKPG